MNYNVKSLTPKECIDQLKNDSDLGSGNFLDKLYALHPEIEEPFIYLQNEFFLKRNDLYSSLSISDIYNLRKKLAAWYCNLGVLKGDVVTLCLSDGIAPFIHYLSITSLGAVASIINPRMPAEMAKQYMRENVFNLLIVDDDVTKISEFVTDISENRFDGCTIINYLDADFDFDDADGFLPAKWPVEPSDNTLVMLSHTSGTTGVSKSVKFEHRQFFMGKRARLGRFAESDDERFLSALPQSHSSAISHLETAVIHGIPTYVLSDVIGESPREAIKEFRPTTVAGFPQTYSSLIQGSIEKNEFPSVRRWFSMGDAMHKEHIRMVLNGSPNARFIDSFGSSELGMALFRKVSTLDNLTPSRCVGRPVDICVAKIIDPETGGECLEDSVGLIGVRSPTITPGYWMKDELTSKSWKNGYFLTGDMGFRKNGEYYLIDRVADCIGLEEVALYTLLLEEKLQELEGVVDASIVAVKEKQGLFIMVLLEDKNLPKEQVRNKITSILNKEASGETVKNTVIALTKNFDSFPTGATGKVLKRQLRIQGEKFMDGNIDPELTKHITYMSLKKDVDLTVA